MQTHNFVFADIIGKINKDINFDTILHTNVEIMNNIHL